MHYPYAWPPAAILAVGAILTLGLRGERTLPLRQPLAAAVPRTLAGRPGEDLQVPADEQQVAGMTTYLLRKYAGAGAGAFSVYVGYYARQTRGNTIHSPKNCLPGAGWQALVSSRLVVSTPGGPAAVNRFVMQNGEARALVLYWYQGRGRIQADEYGVKWNLLRDAVLRQRSDEALVRIVVPFSSQVPEAERLARSVAEQLIPAVSAALPS